jgi:hypothetical protein
MTPTAAPRLIAVAHLGSTQETVDYDGVGDLSSRQFPGGVPDIARYYVGDDLTLVDRGGAGNVGYAHIRLGSRRIATLYAKTGATWSPIYYHRTAAMTSWRRQPAPRPPKA